MFPDPVLPVTARYFDCSASHISSELPPQHPSNHFQQLQQQQQHYLPHAYRAHDHHSQGINPNSVPHTYQNNWIAPQAFNNHVPQQQQFRHKTQQQQQYPYPVPSSKPLYCDHSAEKSVSFDEQHGFFDSINFVSSVSSLSTEENPYAFPRTPSSSGALSRVTSTDSFEELEPSSVANQTVHYPINMPIPYQQYPHHNQKQPRDNNNNNHNSSFHQHQQQGGERGAHQAMGLQTRSSSPSTVHSSGQNSTHSNHSYGVPIHNNQPQNNNNSSGNKCRQLPCRTFISTGSCPYGERCVFLHDPRIMSKPIYIRCKRKSKDDMCIDAFYWPTMPIASVMGVVDNRNMPHIAQPYVVPVPSGFNGGNNDVAVYSMYEHFMDFLKSDSLSVVMFPRTTAHSQDPDSEKNPYTGRTRLPVFRWIGHGNSMQPTTTEVKPMNALKTLEQYPHWQQQQQQQPQLVTDLRDLQPLESPLMNQLLAKPDSVAITNGHFKMPVLPLPPACTASGSADLGKFQRMP